MGRPGITWRRGRDSNPRGSSPGCFQDSCLKPLGHLSGEIVRPQSSQRQSQASTGNNSDSGVCLSSMPVNWKGRAAMRVLSRQSRAKPLQPFPGFPRSDVLVCGRPSLARYYAHTEQVPLGLNTYLDRGRCHQRTCEGRLFCKFAFFSAVAPPRILREDLFCKN